MRCFKELGNGQCGMVTQGHLDGPLGPVILDYNCLNGYSAVLKPVVVDYFISFYEGVFFADCANAKFMFYQELPDPKTLIAAKGTKSLVNEALDDVFANTPIRESTYFDAAGVSQLAERESYAIEGQKMMEGLLENVRLGKVRFVAEEKQAPAKAENTRPKKNFDLEDALRNLSREDCIYGARASEREIEFARQSGRKPPENT